MDNIKIGVYYPVAMPISIGRYTDNITKILSSKNVNFYFFTEKDDELNHVDLIWDPRGGRSAPYPYFFEYKKPVVATFHGAAHLVLSLKDCYGSNILNQIRSRKFRDHTKNEWEKACLHLNHVITVSKYAQTEFENFIQDFSDISYSYHGVDRESFYLDDENKKKDDLEKYFLHVSSYQPKKNIKRIILAYKKIRSKKKPRLKMVVPGLKELMVECEGVDLISKKKSHKEIAEYMRGAVAFVFPSLHETFGMPIIESMSVGTPVITSDNTACREVSENHALLVDPCSVKSISNAMLRIMDDENLREEMSKSSIKHAKKFTWEASADKHFDVFKSIIN